jgi:hypothetical protein
MEYNDIRRKLVNKDNFIDKNYKTIPILTERSTKSSIDNYEHQEIKFQNKKIINDKITKLIKVGNFLNLASRFWFKSNN